MHKVSKMVHYCDSLVCPERMNKSGTLSCGRAMSANYVEAMQFDTVAVCRRCKINAMKDGALPSVWKKVHAVQGTHMVSLKANQKHVAWHMEKGESTPMWMHGICCRVNDCCSFFGLSEGYGKSGIP